jgi:hypothetical protein
LWTALTIAALPEADTWGIVTAYPTMQECESALAKEFARVKGDGWETHYTQARAVLAFKGRGEKITSMAYRCLPDTIDPRGPKAR